MFLTSKNSGGARAPPPLPLPLLRACHFIGFCGGLSQVIVLSEISEIQGPQRSAYARLDAFGYFQVVKGIHYPCHLEPQINQPKHNSGRSIALPGPPPLWSLE